ncbi:MAG: PIN domain-containing protein [Planctomycetota bacterium]
MHIDLLRGALGVDDLASHAPGPLRMSPVVASELLRGGRAAMRATVERLIERIQTIEPPSWRAAFLAAGRLLPEIFPDHEHVGLANLQNDVLLALTARTTGSRLVTRDRHFVELGRRLRFDCVVVG